MGRRGLADADDIAAQSFAILLESRLLTRWVMNRSASLRSLLCNVVRKVLANRQRIDAGRKRLASQMAESIERSDVVDDDPADAFYAAWVEDLVGLAVESLAGEYYRQGKGDYVRVLYGRLCQQLSIAEVAQLLEISPSAVDNYYRHARKHLSDRLQQVVHQQVPKYCLAEDAEQEFAAEWQQLGTYLSEHGGLEEAVRRAYELLDPVASHEVDVPRRRPVARSHRSLPCLPGQPNPLRSRRRPTFSQGFVGSPPLQPLFPAGFLGKPWPFARQLRFGPPKTCERLTKIGVSLHYLG